MNLNIYRLHFSRTEITFTHTAITTMTLIYLILRMIAGALGGQLAGRFYPNQCLSSRGNFLTGTAGGILIGELLAYWGLGVADAELNIELGGIIINFIGSGLGGMLLTLLAGNIRSDVSNY
mgnify:CR=1 FL=1